MGVVADPQVIVVIFKDLADDIDAVSKDVPSYFKMKYTAFADLLLELKSSILINIFVEFEH